MIWLSSSSSRLGCFANEFTSEFELELELDRSVLRVLNGCEPGAVLGLASSRWRRFWRPSGVLIRKVGYLAYPSQVRPVSEHFLQSGLVSSHYFLLSERDLPDSGGSQNYPDLPSTARETSLGFAGYTDHSRVAVPVFLTRIYQSGVTGHGYCSRSHHRCHTFLSKAAVLGIM